jgi:hypothetical protein
MGVLGCMNIDLVTKFCNRSARDSVPRAVSTDLLVGP